ncbi:interleukin-17 receptor A [Betta splendens]|uniref:Interleukin-17 receptor A n=1 Tax=Betta splendens TaxID=158456 RepID=A0A6P7MV76_BETSP|nr:interleukin-17 receptor A [Betta splendens]
MPDSQLVVSTLEACCTVYATMGHVPLFCFWVTAGLAMSPSPWILDKRLSCSRPMEGLDHCRISDCSDKLLAESRLLVPTGPDLVDEYYGVGMDKHGLVPVVTVQWKLKSDASIFNLNGSEISILDETTNQSICVQYFFSIHQQLAPNDTRWTFSLDGVVVEPEHTYSVSVLNLPQPRIGHTEISVRQITVPGCNNKTIQTARVCQENGSLWDPSTTTAVSVDREHERLSIIVTFKTAQYSENYQVSIQSHHFYCSENVSMENRTSVNVTLEFGLWELSQCELLLRIQPFFVQCKNDCWSPTKIINYCHYYPPRTLIIKAVVVLLFIYGFIVYSLWRAVHKGPVNTSSSAAKEQPEGSQVRERKRVLVIYSLDHPLYRNIVLKFCAFLVSTCGTEVVLDLLDSTRLGVLGSIQWLDWRRQQMQSSSDKILILCSRGVQAKWRAMCGDKQVSLREDARSPVGDMLTPALSLMVPHFIRSASFEKYIIAYFDGVCSEDDVPSPFNITVRYKIMKQFEELFFRILDTEKHRPGSVNCIEGLSEDTYHQCSSGRALRDAIQAFRTYQLQHPQWFEDELLERTEQEVEEASAVTYGTAKTQHLLTNSIPDSTQVLSLLNIKESDFTVERTTLYTEQLCMSCSLEVNSVI